ncbi:hypothetical protein FQN55_000638 [Onygenales sp. PD_40]|nr:hypothetical protein FQN55_000638 [Onygenales sp. PD_40]
MAADLDTAGLLPMIKCSNCNADVGISEMGEHLCTRPSQQLTPPPEKDNYYRPFDSPPNQSGFGREGFFSKAGRLGPPPRIDPSAANRPFLRPDLLTPANSDGPDSLAPSPLKRSHTTPLPPTPEPASEDGSYTPFVRSNTVAGSAVRSRLGNQANTPFTHKPFDTSPERNEYSAPIDDDRNNNPSILRSPAPDEDESRGRRKSNRHRREMSIDSKSLRMSAASPRFGDPMLSPHSPRIPSRGRNVLDEVPPLPAGPIKSFTPGPYDPVPSSYRFESKEEYENDRVLATNPPTEEPPGNERKPVGFGSFDFGLPSRPKLPRHSNESSHARQASRSTTRSSSSFRPPVPEKDHPSQPQEQEAEPRSPIREYRIDEEFSVSNFARDLGLNNPFHSVSPSISSIGTAPSDMASGSSFSSQPSEVSSAPHRKPSNADNGYDRNHPSIDLEPIRPRDPHMHDIDSPTDPSFQNGQLSASLSRSNRFKEPDFAQPPAAHGEPVTNKPTGPVPARAPTRRRPQCQGCNLTIVGKPVSCSDGLVEGRYHRECFVCFDSSCNRPFPTGDFYVYKKKPYCAKHYHERNGSLCGSCKEGIEGVYLESEDEAGALQKFHETCFRCKTCDMVLIGDYVEWNGVAYCERDGRRAAAAMYPPPSPSMMMPPGPGYYRRQPYPPPPRGYPSRPGPGPGPGGPGKRYPPPNPNLGVPCRGMNSHRYPERRTTRLITPESYNPPPAISGQI